ncbi:hypothetical protein Ddye_015443 [Dipteronia dyeriana]|uniref:AB hydrolase-1 domain-containing protein n=1 Tax=Dipteronia dyeriana TaxID=168575 RepID=A0AAD9WXW7_9ROSI|nr:hypothetical protein Ddye_015443 [Dipteronia dyeriana]
MVVVLQSDLRFGAVLRCNRALSDSRSVLWRPARIGVGPSTAMIGNGYAEKKKSNICTADELHYVAVSNSDWHLALWRYLPSSKGPKRNHPLLLLSGVGTNAVGYDLSPESSFARFMSIQGFDTWILEVRGAGLSMPGLESAEFRQPLNGSQSTIDSAVSADSKIRSVKVKSTKMISKYEESQSESKLLESVSRLSERLSGFLIEGQRSVKPQFFDFQERLSTSLQDFRNELDLLVKNDWDFDHYLEEDVPAVMEYIRTQSKTKDDKLLAIGHSMGGILLYAMLSRYGSEGKDPGLVAVTTLASSLDYTSSKSSLKLLLPLADPIQALKVPVVPIGALIAAIHPFATRPPYVLSWLNPLISAEDMMHPGLFDKLCLNNFCSVPSKLLLQLKTAFQEGGLCDRSGTFFYKHHLGKSRVPVLALAGDQDLICPPEAVYETVKLIPEHLVRYKVLGEPGGPHYAHYDLVGGRLAVDQVYPCIIEFLARHDMC